MFPLHSKRVTWNNAAELRLKAAMQRLITPYGRWLIGFAWLKLRSNGERGTVNVERVTMNETTARMALSPLQGGRRRGALASVATAARSISAACDSNAV